MRSNSIYHLFALYSFSLVHSRKIFGNWQGNIEVNGQQFPLFFISLIDSTGNLNGKWDSPSQNAMNLPCSDITIRYRQCTYWLKSYIRFL